RTEQACGKNLASCAAQVCSISESTSPDDRFTSPHDSAALPMCGIAPVQAGNTHTAHRNRQSSVREGCTWDAKGKSRAGRLKSMKRRGLEIYSTMGLDQSSHRETPASHATSRRVTTHLADHTGRC